MNQNDTVSILGKQLAGDMPQGSDHLNPANRTKTDSQPAPGTGADSAAPETGPKGEKGKAGVNPKQYSHLKDKNGFSFDPDIHETKKDGTPKLSKNGVLCRRPGRRAGASKSRVFTGPQPGEQAEILPGTESAHYDAAGRAMAQTIFAAGAALFGEEWQPQRVESVGLDEDAQMQSAWADYFRARGVVDVPPGVAVGIAMVSYALPRLSMPKTRNRIKGLIAKFRGRKQKKEKPDSEQNSKEIK